MEMNQTTIAALIAGGSILFAILLTSAILFVLKNVQKKREEEVRKKFKGKRILKLLPNASFIGQSSGAFGAVKGSGVLALTDEELYFELWLPKRELRIPVSDITGISTPASFQTRTVFRPLLQVDFKNANGAPDSVAWSVSELEQWKTAVERLMR